MLSALRVENDAQRTNGEITSLQWTKIHTRPESAYRGMWHRYCHGDVPALKNLEALQLQQPQADKISFMFSDVAKGATVEENNQTALKMNGVNSNSSSTSNLSSSQEKQNQIVNCVNPS